MSFGLCSASQRLRSGDLLFVKSSGSAMSEAISESTSRNDSVSFVHVAIYYEDESGAQKVIEADTDKGVCITAFDEFVVENKKSSGEEGLVIKRLNISFNPEDVINRAMTFIGQPYDWWYLPDNGRMYCSELIYESFIDEKGGHIFRSGPMNFRSADGTMPKFWEDLYRKIGIDVPEGLPGTNPNDLSKDPRLKEVKGFL